EVGGDVGVVVAVVEAPRAAGGGVGAGGDLVELLGGEAVGHRVLLRVGGCFARVPAVTGGQAAVLGWLPVVGSQASGGGCGWLLWGFECVEGVGGVVEEAHRVLKTDAGPAGPCGQRRRARPSGEQGLQLQGQGGGGVGDVPVQGDGEGADDVHPAQVRADTARRLGGVPQVVPAVAL